MEIFRKMWKVDAFLDDIDPKNWAKIVFEWPIIALSEYGMMISKVLLITHNRKIISFRFVKQRIELVLKIFNNCLIL